MCLPLPNFQWPKLEYNFCLFWCPFSQQHPWQHPSSGNKAYPATAHTAFWQITLKQTTSLAQLLLLTFSFSSSTVNCVFQEALLCIYALPGSYLLTPKIFFFPVVISISLIIAMTILFFFWDIFLLCGRYTDGHQVRSLKMYCSLTRWMGLLPFSEPQTDAESGQMIFHPAPPISGSSSRSHFSDDDF